MITRVTFAAVRPTGPTRTVPSLYTFRQYLNTGPLASTVDHFGCNHCRFFGDLLVVTRQTLKAVSSSLSNQN